MARKGKRRGADLSWLAFDARRIAQRLSGAKMCFGAPVHVGERTVIPVASLRTVGGLGFGRSPAPPAPARDAARPAGPAPASPPAPGGTALLPPAPGPPAPPPRPPGLASRPGPENVGAGGGGILDARPLGFIDIGPEGATYRAIPTGRTRAILTGAALAGLGALAGARMLRAPQPSRVRGGLSRARAKRRAATALPWPRR